MMKRSTSHLWQPTAVYVYEADGTPKWNRSLGDFSGISGQVRNANAVVADIDKDDDFEILVGSTPTISSRLTIKGMSSGAL